MNALQQQFDQFKRAVFARESTLEKACFALFAYATDNPVTRPPIETFLDILLGPIKQRASQEGSTIQKSGRLEYTTLSAPPRAKDKPLFKMIGLNKQTVEDLNSMLNGTHPMYGTLEDGKPFDFSTGKQLAHLTVHFEDDVAFVIEVAKGNDFVGVEYFLVKNGDQIATTGLPLKRDSILGRYELFADDSQTGANKDKPTHIVDIQLGD